MFLWIVIIIAVVSVLLALVSLWDLKKGLQHTKVKEELYKNRVVFQSDSSSSSSK
jgi:uncharacterized membrane protein YqiK